MTYVGGVRWRKLTNVSWPLAKLTIGSSGLSIAPSSRRFPNVWRLLGIPTLNVDWSSIGEVELVRSPFSLRRSEGVSFMIDGRRLVFGCGASVAEGIVEEVAQYISKKIVRRDKPKLVI
jgi:hypothetical protein